MTSDRTAALREVILGVLPVNTAITWDSAERLADTIVDVVTAAEGEGAAVEWRDDWRVCAGPADDPAVFKDGIRNDEYLGVVLRQAHDRWSGEYIWAQHRRVGTTEWEAVS